ncbi:MAG: AbrB/MazE/SpoVT family DNA-binding domain-containing protein [Deltaproteobacteria bacterium]|nr:AbrB/MazE/SpoVT family DNA-binding domain-containing protein [Deltaproteobacteria bacterium]
MKARIIQIGKAKGVRLPNKLVKVAHLREEVELAAAPGHITIHSAARPRAGWSASAKRMRERGEDRLVAPVPATKFDEEEWRWR